MVSLPRKTVIHMCKGRDPKSLPEDLQLVLATWAPEPEFTPGAVLKSQDHQPLDLSLVVPATEDLSSNNPNWELQRSTVPRADSVTRAPQISILKRKTTDEAGIERTDWEATPINSPQCAQLIPESHLSHSPILEPLQTPGNIPSAAEDSVTEADLTDPRRIACPQSAKPAPMDSGSAQYCLRSTTKRKLGPQTFELGGPSNLNAKSAQEDHPNALLTEGPDGLFEVQISNSFCEALASSWGVLPEALRREVERDNLERHQVWSQVLETQQRNQGQPPDGAPAGEEL